MKVQMYPSLEAFRNEESGIKRVVEAYHKYLPEYDWDIVGDKAESYDLISSHAGMSSRYTPDVAHIHGLYWTADYFCTKWELKANAEVIGSIRHARAVTVPSNWVAEAFQRDMRFTPYVVPHGIDWADWVHDKEPQGYVLWNKNRNFDVCDPHNVGTLAVAFPRIPFISTFSPTKKGPAPANIKVTGIINHSAMKKLIQSASVYLSTTKETFGIGVLEAMAAGVPVLGYAHGGNVDLIEHGQTGYLAKPGSEEDLIVGLNFCMKYQKQLGANARVAVRKWTWQKACEKLAHVYKETARVEAATVGIIIPTYNYGEEDKLGRAIRSAIEQTYHGVTDIIVVDDGSGDGGKTEKLVSKYIEQDSRVKYIMQGNSGVAVARNRGIEEVETKYVCCLDADDKLAPSFIATCVPDLDADESLGITYTGLWFVQSNEREGLSQWPGEYNFDEQLKRRNQVPTCCLFRRKMWERLGGYRQRYAPEGAGSEDAEFWTRCGAYGWGALKVSDKGLFIYSWQSGRVSGNKEYREPDWLELHPWAKDRQHPFASMATPENKMSHLVRQYDEPLVSVIIPVGDGHENLITSALDTLEGQTFRKWEVVLVWDNAASNKHIETSYPYARIVNMYHQHGAGVARNIGADIARAPLLLFLDADDQLYPTALEEMFGMFKEEESIIYTDYVGKAHISPEEVEKLDKADRLMSYNEKTQTAIIKHESYDYDCELAQAQPFDKRIYLWCLVSSLVPKKWHDEIGGFDENMESWEDWDYWLRMAHAGKCFTRIPRELVVYRFYSGTRRDLGVQENKSLLKYLGEKYKGIKKMPCCGGKKRTPGSVSILRTPNESLRGNETMNNLSEDNELVLCIFDDGNRGQHKIIGDITRRFYGYRGSGSKFYVHKSDVAARPSVFRAIEETKVIDSSPQAPPPPPLPKTDVFSTDVERPVSAETLPVFEDIAKDLVEEIPEDKPANLQGLPGISGETAAQLNAMGVYTPDDVIALGAKGLLDVSGIGPSRAAKIIAFTEKLIADHQKAEADALPPEDVVS